MTPEEGSKNRTIGIVHRDFFVTKDGRVNEPGVVLGTVGYMSPEQVRGESADQRSDIFSFGAILYETLTGSRAFRGATAIETMNAILKEEPPDPSLLGSDLPAGLERLVHQCLEKSREERFQSARDLAFDLEALTALVVVRRVQERHRIEYPVGKVLYTTDGWVSHPRVSPDGSRIAFFDHPTYGDDAGSVAVLDSKGRKTTLSEGWVSEQGLAWAPSGNEVWFTAGAAPGPRHELQAVTLGGRRRVVLRAPGSLHLYDISRDGRILLSHDVTREGILCVAPGQSRERDLSWQDLSYATDLSADGKTVVIAEQGEGAGPNYAVYLRGTDGAPAVRLGDGHAFSLSPDKNRVLALLLKEPQELLLLPTGAGEPRHLKRGTIQSYGLFGSWFPDGRRIQFNGREPGRGTRLYVQAIDGDPRPISPEGVKPAAFGHALSPDGRFVVARDSEDRGWLYPVDGGDPKPLPGLSQGENPAGWSADGRALS